MRTFFQGAGVPAEVLDVLPTVTTKVAYSRCFIAYGQPDAEFAEKLYGLLKEVGVTCWLYELDATPGERTWKEITEQLREAERVIVICSASALVRDGLLKELEKLIDEEPQKIVPVSVDDLWEEPGFRVVRGVKDLKPFLSDRNYVDFHSTPFEEATKRLLKGLTSRPAR
jgi:hypothetical protein